LSRRRQARPGRAERARGRANAAPRKRDEQPSAREAVEALLREQLGYRGFRAGLEAEAEAAAAVAQSDGGARRDLTALSTFTVDPATARDFDDAVSAQREGSGARVWIHIADVAAHVRPGSPLDVEARRRANSTYVPGAVEPMLPHALSSEACSLAPGVERLAVTAEIELGPGAEPRSARFYRSRIRSDARLDYDQLDAIFAGRATPPEEVAEPLAAARAVAGALGEQRGVTSLDVESAEPEFRFDGAGNVTGAHRVPQTEAHRLIERLMILTNEQVAEFLQRRRVPAIYRVHAQPDPARIERLVEQLAALGVPTPPLGQGLSAQAASRPRGRAARPRPRGVYIARAPLPQASCLQRAQQRPRRPRQRCLHAFHLADPPLPRPGRAPGAAGGAGGGGGGAAAGRGADRRRRLLRPGAGLRQARARGR